MKLIQSQTLGSASSGITFSDIPQNFTDLYFLMSCRTSRSASGNADGINIQFNTVTTGYTSRVLYGLGSGTPTSEARTDSLMYYAFNPTDSTANTFSNTSITVPNYTGATNKSYSMDAVTENNATLAAQTIAAGLWSNTAAITSALIRPSNGVEFLAGSTISLYGIGGAGDVYLPKATGGSFQLIDGYWVHTFTSSGTFTPLESLSNVEYLVIAGGGGGGGGVGGSNGAGGGGAGGYRTSVTGATSGGGGSAESKLSLSAGTGYTVTVGAGGAGATNNTDKGATGSDSVFSTITSAGGGGGGARNSGAGLTGGSGGGSSWYASASSGTTNQGYGGGTGTTAGGGGGGAGSIGASTPSDTGANGGSGVSSSINGVATTRAVGGNGGNSGNLGSVIAGNANTGTGGGGARGSVAGAAGGSGIVIVRYAA